MKKIIPLLFLAFLISCSETDDDSSLVCNTDCTTIQGRVISSDNQSGISGVEVTFYFTKAGSISAQKRIIGSIFTDNNGGFSMKKFINDEELNGISTGSFSVDIIEGSVNDDYVRDLEPTMNSEGYFSYLETGTKLQIDRISNRDTIINYDLMLLKKEFINIKVENFNPIDDRDQIIISNNFLSGINSSIENSQHSFTLSNQFLQQNFEFDLIGAKNFNNRLIISRIKNGIHQTPEIIDIQLNSSQDMVVQY